MNATTIKAKDIHLHDIVSDAHWEAVRALLPNDLDESAEDTGALVRARQVHRAEDLIRMFLVYGVSDLSMKEVAAWAKSMGIADITAPAFFYRLREAKEWLQRVLAQTLISRIEHVPEGYCLRVVDATVLTGPGAKGTEWRVHALIDPVQGAFEAVEVTDEHGGEGYSRCPVEPGDIILGDSAYSRARGIEYVWDKGGHVVVRLNPHTLRLCYPNKERADVFLWDEKVPQEGVESYSLLMPVPPEGEGKGNKTWSLSKVNKWISVRLAATRMQSGEVLWILTTLPESVMSAEMLLALYRVRWQVEMFFKRLKSILHLDELPSRKGPTAKSWITARLLAAALAQALLEPVPLFPPWRERL